MGEKVFEFGSSNLLEQLLLDIFLTVLLSDIYYTSKYSTTTLCLSINHMDEPNMNSLRPSTENKTTRKTVYNLPVFLCTSIIIYDSFLYRVYSTP